MRGQNLSASPHRCFSIELNCCDFQQFLSLDLRRRGVTAIVITRRTLKTVWGRASVEWRCCILASGLDSGVSYTHRPAPIRISIWVVCRHKFKVWSLHFQYQTVAPCRFLKTSVESCPLRPAQIKAAALSEKRGIQPTRPARTLNQASTGERC